MSEAASVATERREDISRLIVHLTRDDTKTFSDGNTARENFRAIMRSRKIRSVRPHCLHNEKIKKLPKEIRKKFNVACFTEVPLNQIHLLAGQIPGRQIKLEPYGVVFTKKFIVSKGGQPAIYVNSYGFNTWLRDSADALFDAAWKDEKLTPKLWRLLPFINAMHEKYDFSWEREWRVRNDLEFTYTDIVCAILPATGEEEFKEKFAKAGIAVISPGWTYEQIVTELAGQQRNTLAYKSLVEGQSVSSEKNERSNAEE